MSDITAPRSAERLLESLGANTDFRDAVLGDLAEEFAIRLQWDGPTVARRWYYRESLRVAPYFLRSWARNLRWSHVGYFSGVVLAASLCTIALDNVLLRVSAGALPLMPGVSLHALPSPVAVPLMLLWTLVDGTFAGYVAARVGRRAPVPSALLVAMTWLGLMLGTGWSSVPPWFLAMNVTTMVLGTLAGSAIPTVRAVRSR